jgi:hypothetical protein
MPPHTLVSTLPAMDALARMIGNIPPLAIDVCCAGRARTVRAKCEYLNLPGSIKDRMALHIPRRAQKLPARLSVGISSGCSFLAATQVRESLAKTALATASPPDDNEKYLTTDLLREEPVKPGYLSPELELTGIRVLPRNCLMCGPRQLPMRISWASTTANFPKS